MPGASSCRLLVGHEPPRRVEQASAGRAPATASTRPDPHSPCGSTSPITPSSSVVGAHLHDLDRARRRPHAAPDRGALERRAGRGGGGEEPVAVAEHELAVRADVQEQPHPRVAVHPRGQEPGDDVAADVSAEGGEDHRPGAVVDLDPDLGRQDLGEQPVDMMNGATPSASGSMPSAMWVMVALPARATSYTSDGLTPPSSQTACASSSSAWWASRVSRSRARSSIMIALMRVMTSAPNALLRVEHRLHRHRRARRQVEQRRDDRRRAEVEGDAEQAPARVARLDVDEHVVDHDRGHLVVASRAAPAQGAGARAGPDAARGRRGSPSRRSRSVVWSARASARSARRSASAPQAGGSPFARRRPSLPSGG